MLILRRLLKIGKNNMNTYGINFDIGLPLKEQQEFDILYVDYLPELSIRFSEWLSNEKSSSLVIAGQIGTGKSTFINRFKIKADISLQLDQLFPKTKGGFYGAFLGQLLNLSLTNKIDLATYGFENIYKPYVQDIPSFIDLLISDTINLSLLEKQSKLFKLIEENLSSIQKQLNDLISKNSKILDRKLFIFAEGVDKFNPNVSSDLYNELVDFLNFIINQKTLYEANFIHISENSQWIQDSEKLIIPNADDTIIKQVLEKRLGIYVDAFQNILPEIVKYSGGNFRQGIKILVEYEFAKRKLNKNENESLYYALTRVKNDYFSYVNIPFNLLKVISRDNFIYTGTFKFEEKRTDSYPVYRNLILIGDSLEKNGEWKAIVNPLFQEVVEEYKPERKKQQQSDELVKYNFTEILDKLATYFLEPNKKEIVIIIYDDIEIAHIVDDYLVGKAGSYDEVFYKSIDIEGDIVANLLTEYPKKPFTGQSYFFKEELTQETIIEIDKLRDRLIMNNMLWWINKEHITVFIKNLIQLRQFIKIFDLRKDILDYIDPSEIKQDIEDLELLDYTGDDNLEIENRLRQVLKYIKSK